MIEIKDNKFVKRLTAECAFNIFNLKLPEWIKYNPELSKENGAQYEIIRKMSHDGTMIFELELMGKVLQNLYNRTSYFVSDGEESVKRIAWYEVGDLVIESEYCDVDFLASRLPGEKQTISMAVKVHLDGGL